MTRTRYLLFLVILMVAVSAPAGADDFVIVVHPEVEGSRISRSVLAGIYQGDVVRWGDRARIRPVDQSSQAPLRHDFIRAVLGQSLGELQGHWEERMATQRQMPPTTKATDEDVLAFVSSKKGAIGYVDAGMELPPGVKTLTLVD